MKNIVLILFVLSYSLLHSQSGTVNAVSKPITLKPLKIITDHPDTIITPKVNRPEIFITFPEIDDEDNSIVQKDEWVSIKGMIYSGSSIKNLTINSQDVDINNDNSFSRKIQLNNGENFLKISVTDIHENKSDTTFIVHKRNDYALLIGTDEYESFNNLVNPVFDATTIQNELKDYYEFNTELVKNPTKDQFLSAIRNCNSREYGEYDQLLIFIAGHGEFDDNFGQGYLITSDSEYDDENKLSYLPYSYLREIINNIHCKHILLVIDACFSGTINSSIAKRGSKERINNKYPKKFIKNKLKYTTRIYITSGGKEYVPDGRPGYHSPFARKFLEALRFHNDGNSILTFNSLLTYLEKVENNQPYYSEFGDNQVGSNFIFDATEK